jgi:group I intron endonuclease
MIATAFLGFLTIAQNDRDLSTTIIAMTIATTVVTTIINFPLLKYYIRFKNNVKPISLKFTQHSTLQPQGKRYYSSVSSNGYSKTLNNFIKSKNLNPVFVYDDLDKDFVKTSILEDTRDLSGIYLILNKVNMDYYIGSASTGKLYTRFARHLVNFNGSKIVKNAVKKYKLPSFAFMILELYPEIINERNNKDLLNLEDFYLKSLLPNYNILTEAGSSFGFKHTDLTRIKMKANYSEERRERIGSLNRGKTLSAATIESIRKAGTNSEKAIYSEQAFTNMKKTAKPILVQNLDKTIYGKYPSIVEMAKALDCSIKTVHISLKSPTKLLKRSFIVSYIV